MNNIAFNAFASLAGALQRIRRTERFLRGRPHLIGLDQMCINQSDLPERESQVLLMRDIYANSGRAMVWLGDEGAKHSLNF